MLQLATCTFWAICAALVIRNSSSYNANSRTSLSRFHGVTQSLLHAGKGFDVAKLANKPPEPQEDLSKLDIEGLAQNKELMFQKLKSVLRGTCVNFVGMMGCGKSTIGKLFADNVGYRYLDTDEIAEYMIEMPIATYFAQSEENIASFRQLEQQILQELAQYTRVVISTGGGIVERNENWGYLRHGIVVWINMLPEEIYERLRAKPEEIAKRPLLKGDNPLGKLQELHEKRLDKYQQADITVDVARDATPEQLAELVAVKILTFIKANPPLWKTWSQKRSENALEAAGLMNPAAASTKGFGNQEKKGSIKYVSMQDIQSGKVKLPDGVQIPFPNGLPKDEQ